MNARDLATALVAAGITVAAAGCGTDPVAASATAPPVSALRVGLIEWQIVTSGTALTPGIDQLTVTNAGTTGHDLYVAGPGVHAHTALLSPGASATLTITARPGTTLTLTCQVPGHEAAGMRTSVTVGTEVQR